MSAMPTVTILSEGKAIPSTYSILSIETTKVVNKIPYAQIVLIDGNAAKQDFPISASPFFQPGKSIEIKLRAENETADSTVFKGIVVSQNIQSSATASQLIVELKDICIRLDGARNSAIYTEQNIHQVIETILKRNEVSAGVIEGNPGINEQLIQYQSSDWDFLLMRADVNELVIMVDDGQLSAITPDLNKAAQHQFSYGISPCYGFEMNANISQQYSSISANYWDIQTQKVSPSAVAKNIKLSQGENLSLDQITQEINHDMDNLSSMVNGSDPQMQAWANSGMQKSRLSVFRGTITLAGDAGLKLGDLMEISGVGALFDGKTLITGVSQIVNSDGWQTMIQFGLSDQWYAEQYPNISALPAAGLLPNISGLQIGIVEYFQPDPQREFRLQVRVPALNDPNNIVWARLSTLYAGKDKGLFFVPDVGDEVIVGFINEDPRDAIILGAAYSEKNNPPQGFDFTEENNRQGIITKGNLRLSFDDASETITLTTPPEDEPHNEIRLQTKEGITLSDQFDNTFALNEDGIRLKDKHGNAITMSADGIELKSTGGMIVNADKEIALTAHANMKLKGKMIDLN